MVKMNSNCFFFNFFHVTTTKFSVKSGPEKTLMTGPWILMSHKCNPAHLLGTEWCLPTNSHVEVLTPNVLYVKIGSTRKEVIKVK